MDYRAEPLELSTLMPSTSQEQSYALWCEHCAKVWHRAINLNARDKRTRIASVVCSEHSTEDWAGARVPVTSFLLASSTALFRDYALGDIAHTIAAWIRNRYDKE